MTSSRGMARVRYAVMVLLGLIVAGGGYLLIRTAQLNKAPLRAEITARLSDWAGAPVQIYGPVELSYFPTLSVRTGGLSVSSAPNVPYLDKLTTQSLSLEIGVWSLLGRMPDFERITLVKPELILSGLEGGQNSGAAASFSRAIGAIPVRRLLIEDGKAIVNGTAQREEITGINSEIQLSADGAAISLSGDLTWRKANVEITLKSALPGIKPEVEQHPFELTVKAPLATAELDGESAIANGFQLRGDLDLQIANLRQFARWLGLLIPDGPGFGSFTASGPFQWQGARMGFDEGSFVLDGNRALGTLGLEAGGARPKIDGTLAFTTIALSQYFPRQTASDTPAKSGRNGQEKKKPRPILLDFPVLHHLDLDLRLSTTRILTGPLPLGQTAFSVAVKSGSLIADFAVLDLCGGTGSGRLSFDAAVPDTEVRLTGHLTGIAANTCIEAFTPVSPLNARTNIVFDLTSSGRQADDLLSHMTGTATFKALAGELSLDLNALDTDAIGKAEEPLTLLQAGTTKFSEATGELVFRKGSIYGADLVILSEPKRYTGDGRVDYAKKTIEFQIVSSEMKPKETGDTVNAATDTPKPIFLEGPWDKPRLSVGKAEPVRAGQ